MTELKDLHSAILAGGNIAPFVDGLKTAIASFTEEVTQTEKSKDRTLLTLSVVIDLLRESHKNGNYRKACVEVIPKHLAAALVQSFSKKDRFIGFLACKIIVLLLSHPALRNEAIHSLKTLIDKLSHNILMPFERQQVIDILILLYSSKKLWPDDSELLQEIQSSRQIVLVFLQPAWSQIVNHALSITSSWSSVDLTSFASLWKKIIKYVDSLEEKSEFSRQKMKIFSAGVGQILQRICSKNIDSVALCRLLKVCNSCLPYSERMSSRQKFQEHHYHLVESVHTSVRKGLFGQIPSDQLSFIGPTSKRSTPSQNSYVLHRQVALLVFKSCALTTLLALEDKNKSDLSSAGKHMLQVNTSLLSLWSWLRDESSSTSNGHWLLDVFADQDNALIESMLCLMDVYVNIKLKKLPTSSPFLLKVIDPHLCFLNFLQNLSFDHSVLLDFLSSPETCFLLYFIKYLHFVVREWEGFRETCEQFNNAAEIGKNVESLESVSDSSQKQSVDHMMDQLDKLDKMTTDTQGELLKLLHRVNTERILLSQQASSKSVEKNVHQLSLRNKAVEKVVRSANILLDGANDVSALDDSKDTEEEVMPSASGESPLLQHGMVMNLTGYSDDDDDGDISKGATMTVTTTVEQSLMNVCSKYLDKDSDLAALGEMINSTKLSEEKQVLKLTDYPSSDEEMESVHTESNLLDNNLDELNMSERKSLICGIKETTSTENIEMMDTGEIPNTITPGGSSDELVTPPSDTTLDNVMSAIIRLRIVLERLAEKQLFPYNAKPLINVLEQCELRYEENA